MLHSNKMAARERRVFLPRENPLQGLNDTKTRKAYRFTRAGVEYVVNLLADDLQYETNRNNALTVVLQVCIALMYFAGGSLLYQIARAHRVSNATVSRCVRRVTMALVRRRSEVGNLILIFILQ